MVGADAKTFQPLSIPGKNGEDAAVLGPVAGLLEACSPLLVLLAAADGRLVASTCRGQHFERSMIRSLAKDLAKRLSGGSEHVYSVQTAAGYCLAFAARLPDAADSILGGLVQLSESAEDKLYASRAALVACGTAAWTAIHARRAANEMQARLSHVTKLQSVGQLTAGIVHEINVPAQYVRDNTRFVEDAFEKVQSLLAACLDLCEAAGKQAVDQEAVAGLVAAAEQANLPFLMREIPAALDQSLQGLDLVTRLVNSMNEYTHGGTQESQAVELNRVVEAALTVCRGQWKHVADVVTDLDPATPTVECTPGDVHQVLINLIVNAAHAIEDKSGEGAGGRGTITVRTRHGSGWVEVRVEDTGTGIAENIRDRVFERYFTTKRPQRGTGQGLAIARSIVEQRLGGTVSFTSQVGRGTEFVVRIPCLAGVAVCGIPGHEEADPVC